MSKRVFIYVDGFNLYHAIDDLNQDHLKWLNLWALGTELLPQDGSESLVSVKYFSAYATWRPQSYRLHQRYVAALKAHGVTVVMGRFKEKRTKCRSCGRTFMSHEEKETDVNIGAHLMADGLSCRYDRALVVSADTDLNGVVELARAETGKLIQIVAPPGRKGRNRASTFEITKGRVRRSLLPEQCTHEGRMIVRPSKYDPPAS